MAQSALLHPECGPISFLGYGAEGVRDTLLEARYPNPVQRARSDFLKVLSRKQLSSAAEQGGCSDLHGIGTRPLRPSKRSVNALRSQGGRTRNFKEGEAVCKRAGDQRTDLQSEQLPSPASGGQPSSLAPGTLSFEMQPSGDRFSLSLATHTHTPTRHSTSTKPQL